jgi:hypothetical protein
MPKGEKLRGQSKWISQPLVILSKLLLLQNLVSYGGEFGLWEKGEFLVLDKFFSWNSSLFAQTSMFDLEIGKRICFAKINQVVAKLIQICQILSEENLVFNLHSFVAF